MSSVEYLSRGCLKMLGVADDIASPSLLVQKLSTSCLNLGHFASPMSGQVVSDISESGMVENVWIAA